MATYSGSASVQSETYDGTTWTVGASSANTRGDVASGYKGGPAGDTFIAGGNAPVGVTAVTEEYNAGSPASPTGVAASTLTTS